MNFTWQTHTKWMNEKTTTAATTYRNSKSCFSFKNIWRVLRSRLSSLLSSYQENIKVQILSTITTLYVTHIDYEEI